MLNKKTVDDLKDLKGKRVLVRCDFNVPLKGGEISDETRIVAALPTIKKLIGEGAKVILCSHLGKVKNGPNEGESLAPVAARLTEKLGKEVVFVADYNVTGEAAAKAVEAMGEGDVVLLQNPRQRRNQERRGVQQGAGRFGRCLCVRCFRFLPSGTCFCRRRDQVHHSQRRRKCSRLSDAERD